MAPDAHEELTAGFLNWLRTLYDQRHNFGNDGYIRCAIYGTALRSISALPEFKACVHDIVHRAQIITLYEQHSRNGCRLTEEERRHLLGN